MKPTPRLGRTVTEAVTRQLRQFGETSPGIRLVVVTSADGFEVASWHGGGNTTPASRVAAMSSSLTALADAICQETVAAPSQTLIVESAAGTVLLLGLRDAKPPLALAVVADREAILGHLLWAARNTAAAVVRLVDH